MRPLHEIRQLIFRPVGRVHHAHPVERGIERMGHQRVNVRVVEAVVDDLVSGSLSRGRSEEPLLCRAVDVEVHPIGLVIPVEMRSSVVAVAGDHGGKGRSARRVGDPVGS